MQKYTQIKDLDIEEFKNYYYNHSSEDTRKHFNMSSDTYYKFIAQNNFPHIRQGKIEQTEGKLNKEDVLFYYEDHTLEDTAKFYNTTPFILDNLFNKWGVKKHSIAKNRELGCLKKYGVKSYNSTDDFKNKMHKFFTDMSDEDKKLRSERISNSFQNMDPDKASERLKKIFSSPNAIISKPNIKFKKLLELNGFKNIETEFVINKYLYDFKVNNWLIELNPFATHNSTWGYRNGNPKSKYYHYNKTNTALKNGYNCICIWDWSDRNKTLDIINNNNYNCIQKSIKCHLYNWLTLEHKIVNEEPKQLLPTEVIIWDDGQDLN